MATGGDRFDFDFIVIGSGFGGSVSTLRLAEKGYRVAVIEMGRRWAPQSFPRTSWSIHRWIWRPGFGLRGFFNMRLFRHATIFHGCAVGGGSITYAATLLPAPEHVWQSGSWRGLANWTAEMPGYYQTASTMLGVTENKILGTADLLLKYTAEATGCGSTFYPTRVGILQASNGEAGQTLADPFFGGEGPARSTCRGCGGCMMGCRFGAKNTLDLNYLYLAEQKGAQIIPETRVVDVRPISGSENGACGYEVCTVRSTAWIQREPRRFRCRGIVFSASALGTMELLFRLKEKDSLPGISAAVGKHVRTNSESIIGARMPNSADDLSEGIAIGSGIYIDEHTHIEAVRYPKGSDVMGLLTTMLTDGEPGPKRIALWARNIMSSLIFRPIRTLRLFRLWGWARESTVLLCMQAVEGHIEMRWQRRWFWPFGKMLCSYGDRVPTYIPKANQFARKFAQIAGGSPMSMVAEILFDVPGTAHCIGGCVIADSPERGVVDSRHRVFGYRNMYICDGSVLAANLGVNPSLTITALAERAMTFIPTASSNSWDDAPQFRKQDAAYFAGAPAAKPLV
jgi:cholesterol oxidase